MSIVVDAVFQNGVFKPIQPVQLSENENVRLVVQSQSSQQAALDWLKQLRATRQELRQKYGSLPDSLALITEERSGDE